MRNARHHFFAVVTIALGTGLSINAQQNELRSVANSLAQDISTAGKRTIAVVDFTDLQGRPTELGRFLAEEFAVALTRARKGFDVIDRTHLKTLLTEHKLASTGLIDPATAKKLGQIAGVDALVTGSLTPFSESVRIAIKVLATDTARIMAADNVDLPKTKTISELIGGPPTATTTDEDRPPRLVRSDNDSSRRDAARAAIRQLSSPVAAAEEFVYELVECRGLGDSVRCSFRVTNRGKDRNLSLRCDPFVSGNPNLSRAFDNLGNESDGATCTISNRDRGEAHLISGVPVPASILFKAMSSSASVLALISIAGFSDDDKGYSAEFKISFRNVPIVR